MTTAGRAWARRRLCYTFLVKETSKKTRLSRHLACVALAAAAGLPAGAQQVARVQDAPPAASADPAWDAALDLKRKASYPEAAAAFEAWAQQHPGALRAPEALTEAGVCWFSAGRAQLKLLRRTPEADASFAKALGYFDRAKATGSATYAPRAQYMRGSTRYFMDDMPGAEAEYSIVLDKWKSDAKYTAKALERRATVRRNRLDTKGALADLQRYATEFPQGDDIKAVKLALEHAKMFGKPAPEIAATAWIQGEPRTLASLKGDLVFIYFFATWCENCETIRPFILDVHERFEPFGVKCIGVVDGSKGQTIESVRAFLGPNKIRFPVAMTTGATAVTYGATGIPELVIIDRAGRVRWNDNPNNLMDSTIEALLVEDPAQAPPK
jgi:thiol-disulfide isomerase/thioredoxin